MPQYYLKQSRLVQFYQLTPWQSPLFRQEYWQCSELVFHHLSLIHRKKKLASHNKIGPAGKCYYDVLTSKTPPSKINIISSLTALRFCGNEAMTLGAAFS